MTLNLTESPSNVRKVFKKKRQDVLICRRDAKRRGKAPTTIHVPPKREAARLERGNDFLRHSHGTCPFIINDRVQGGIWDPNTLWLAIGRRTAERKELKRIPVSRMDPRTLEAFLQSQT